MVRNERKSLRCAIYTRKSSEHGLEQDFNSLHAQCEREVAGERIRDKFAASRRKGMWMGGTIPLGYVVKDRKLVVNAAEAETVRLVFRCYLALGCVSKLRAHLDQQGVRSKPRTL